MVVAGVSKTGNFAPAMKKIAALLFFIFILVQAGLTIGSLYSGTISVCMVNEEKTDEKTDEKENTVSQFQSSELFHRISTAPPVAEKILTAPCLEKLIPPPNFFYRFS